MDIAPFTHACEKTIAHLKEEFGLLQLGRASTGLVDHLQIYIPAWGSTTPMNSIANVSLMDSQTIKIEAYNKGDQKSIEKGIVDANIGLNPLNQGDYIMIKIPPLTTERRQELTKLVNKEGEDAKVAFRNARHDMRNEIEKQFKAKEISENERDALYKQIDETTKKYNEKVDEMAKIKSEEIMKI